MKKVIASLALVAILSSSLVFAADGNDGEKGKKKKAKKEAKAKTATKKSCAAKGTSKCCMNANVVQ
jgi:topoisomerase IA-like protein